MKTLKYLILLISLIRYFFEKIPTFVVILLR